jgi:hypothetical protein
MESLKALFKRSSVETSELDERSAELKVLTKAWQVRSLVLVLILGLGFRVRVPASEQGLAGHIFAT